MAQPTEIGRRLKALREATDYSQREVGLAIGRSESFIKNIESGKSQDPGVASIIAAVRYMGYEPNVLFEDLPLTAQPANDEHEHDNHRPSVIKALGDEYAALPRWQIEASAGGGNAIIPEPESRYRLLFRSAWLRRITDAPLDEIITVEVSGNSMEPTLKHGDLVLADRTDTTPREDAIFVVDDNHEARIKRVLVEHGTGHLVLRSDNELVKDSLPAPPSVRKIVGRVFWVGRQF